MCSEIFGTHYELGYNGGESIKRIAAKVADLTEKVITDEIIRAAREAGVTDLYLMDRDFLLSAIREKQERMNPKPLTLDELRQMDGEPVFVKSLVLSDEGWCIVFVERDGDISAHIPAEDAPYFGGSYGKGWIAYRYKPKEANNEA